MHSQVVQICFKMEKLRKYLEYQDFSVVRVLLRWTLFLSTIVKVYLSWKLKLEKWGARINMEVGDRTCDLYHCA